MDRQIITAEIIAWLAQALDDDCARDDILAAMAETGWEPGLAAIALEEAGLLRAAAATTARLNPPRRYPRVGPIGAGPDDAAAGPSLRVQLALGLPRITVFDGLLSDAECAGLIAAGRTGPGCALLRERVSAAFRWPAARLAEFATLRHDPDSAAEMQCLAAGRAPPLAALIACLAAPDRGGNMIFPAAGLAIPPARGRSVLICYDMLAVERTARFHIEPVCSGVMWQASLVFRDAHLAEVGS